MPVASSSKAILPSSSSPNPGRGRPHIGARLLKLRTAGPALVGQGLNVVALLVPIVLNRVDQIAFSVTVVALGGITVYLGILSFHNVYPSLAREADAKRALLLSTGLLSVVTGVVALAFALSPGISHNIRQYGLWTAVSAFAQGCYLMATAVQVRAQHYRAVALSRLWYGLANLTLTSAACFWPQREALSAATSGSFVLAVGIMVATDWMFWVERFRGSRFGLRWSVRYLREHGYSAVSGVLAASAVQAGALAVPGLPTAIQSVWAVALRFGGGFGTVARYVAAPMFEIDIASGTRFGDAEKARRANNKALRLGLGLGLLGAAGVALSAGFSAIRNHGAHSFATVCIAVVFIVAWVIPMVAWNNLVLIRRPRDFLLWTIVKTAALAVAILTLHDLTLLMTFTAIEIVANTTYVLLLRGRLRQAASTWVRRPSPGAWTENRSGRLPAPDPQ